MILFNLMAMYHQLYSLDMPMNMSSLIFWFLFVFESFRAALQRYLDALAMPFQKCSYHHLWFTAWSCGPWRTTWWARGWWGSSLILLSDFPSRIKLERGWESFTVYFADYCEYLTFFLFHIYVQLDGSFFAAFWSVSFPAVFNHQARKFRSF